MLLFCLIFLQCYYSIRTALQLAFGNYFKVCFEVQKIWLPFFSCQSLLLGTSVPNDIFISPLTDQTVTSSVQFASTSSSSSVSSMMSSTILPTAFATGVGKFS